MSKTIIYRLKMLDAVASIFRYFLGFPIILIFCYFAPTKQHAPDAPYFMGVLFSFAYFLLFPFKMIKKIEIEIEIEIDKAKETITVGYWLPFRDLKIFVNTTKMNLIEIPTSSLRSKKENQLVFFVLNTKEIYKITNNDLVDLDVLELHETFLKNVPELRGC